MCIAFPMQIVAFEDETHGIAECGGVTRKVNTRLLKDCRVGDYVLVHAGYAIEKVSPEIAGDQLAVFRELEENLYS